MGVNFTPEESFALYELLAQNTSEIILKTDRDGFILHASPGSEELGERLGAAFSSSVVGHHLLDLAQPAWAEVLHGEVQRAVRGGGPGAWIEFPAPARDGRERWFEIRMRALADDAGAVTGTIAIMRSIEERVAWEDKLFAAAMTDPLTGLTNRPAFISMLRHLVDRQVGGHLAVFAIDHFKAMNMQHGQAFGDEVLVVFSSLLRTTLHPESIISRIGDERLAVLLPRARAAQAEAVCQRVLATLDDVHRSAGPGSQPITASVGAAPIGHSLDATLKQAELSLFLAKAKGGNRLEMSRGAGAAPEPARECRRLAG